MGKDKEKKVDQVVKALESQADKAKSDKVKSAIKKKLNDIVNGVTK